MGKIEKYEPEWGKGLGTEEEKCTRTKIRKANGTQTRIATKITTRVMYGVG